MPSPIARGFYSSVFLSHPTPTQQPTTSLTPTRAPDTEITHPPGDGASTLVSPLCSCQVQTHEQSHSSLSMTCFLVKPAMRYTDPPFTIINYSSYTIIVWLFSLICSFIVILCIFKISIQHICLWNAHTLAHFSFSFRCKVMLILDRATFVQTVPFPTFCNNQKLASIIYV